MKENTERTPCEEAQDSSEEEQVDTITVSVRADDPTLLLLCSHLEMEPRDVLYDSLSRGIDYFKMECMAELNEYYENELLRMMKRITELKQEVAKAREQPAPSPRKRFWNALMGNEEG